MYLRSFLYVHLPLPDNIEDPEDNLDPEQVRIVYTVHPL